METVREHADGLRHLGGMNFGGNSFSPRGLETEMQKKDDNNNHAKDNGRQSPFTMKNQAK